ncbi:TetR family transcriptional regulator [Sinimarinibacterium sp. CAU 1509]|uniref:TetR/AcrR family transcriptional regulator n=1 Tax=Sinimarinibacterium sp. CAU 1509 TaxID=2562283 RepID=UPI0010ACA7C7|nr:TetR/AcrR family transcriptional regulator [Sinimarinibacterium sp. CAU 1509]TJY62057.1 TetR family transcriptional regulator [Sinimarinibacterium sp. CAU 1509]
MDTKDIDGKRHSERKRWTPISAAERHSRLIQAAICVIARDGLPATSTRSVALEAGMNQAMLHYTFASKEELLLAVLDAMHGEARTIIEKGARSAVTLEKAIRRASAAYWKHVQINPALHKAQYELTLYALTSPNSPDLARKQYDGYVDILLHTFAHIEPHRPRAQLEQIAAACIAAMDGLILQFLAGGNVKSCGSRLKWIIDAICSAAAAEPKASEQKRRRNRAQ